MTSVQQTQIGFTDDSTLQLIAGAVHTFGFTYQGNLTGKAIVCAILTSDTATAALVKWDSRVTTDPHTLCTVTPGATSTVAFYLAREASILLTPGRAVYGVFIEDTGGSEPTPLLRGGVVILPNRLP